MNVQNICKFVRGNGCGLEYCYSVICDFISWIGPPALLAVSTLPAVAQVFTTAGRHLEEKKMNGDLRKKLNSANHNLQMIKQELEAAEHWKFIMQKAKQEVSCRRQCQNKEYDETSGCNDHTLEIIRRRKVEESRWRSKEHAVELPNCSGHSPEIIRRRKEDETPPFRRRYLSTTLSLEVKKHRPRSRLWDRDRNMMDPSCSKSQDGRRRRSSSSHKVRPPASIPLRVNIDRLLQDNLREKLTLQREQENLYRDELIWNLEENAKLKREVSELTRQQRGAAKKEENLDKENERLKDTINELKRLLSAAELRVEKKEAAADQLQRQLDKAEEYNRQLRRKFKGQDLEVRKGRSEGDEMRRKVQSAEAEIQKLRKENENLRYDLDQKQEAIRKMKSDVHKDDDDFRRMQEKLRRRDAQVKELEGELRRMDENYELCHQDFKRVKVQLRDFQEENGKLQRQLQALLEYHHVEEKEMLEVDRELNSLMNFYNEYIHNVDKGKCHQPFELPRNVLEIKERINNYY
ncbi:golgin subfamily A member 6-like protein 22 [Macrobrachium rosenbergii]|uniref:golgin subfamily A member 6-like protein 22 n=1 Tax=Macrobrachium rosenbergii TaxID=79674 RepID=UPI0034D72A9D